MRSWSGSWMQWLQYKRSSDAAIDEGACTPAIPAAMTDSHESILLMSSASRQRFSASTLVIHVERLGMAVPPLPPLLELELVPRCCAAWIPEGVSSRYTNSSTMKSEPATKITRLRVSTTMLLGEKARASARREKEKNSDRGPSDPTNITHYPPTRIIFVVEEKANAPGCILID